MKRNLKKEKKLRDERAESAATYEKFMREIGLPMLRLDVEKLYIKTKAERHNRARMVKAILEQAAQICELAEREGKSAAVAASAIRAFAVEYPQ